MAKEKYGLNDEELASLLEYSVRAAEADRAYEVLQTRKMCDRRGEFQSLYDLGIALNDLTEIIESNQERLGRDAEAVLGPMIIMKVNTVLLNSQHHYDDAFGTDWPVLLATRNSDLSTELEQVCDWLGRSGADEARN